VSLAGDGKTAVAGAPGDRGGTGAVWVFVRAGGVWRQQGAKLVGSGAGGFGDWGGVGAARVFAPAGAVGRQQGPKLVGTGAVDAALVGAAMSPAGDARPAVIGAPADARIGPPGSLPPPRRRPAERRRSGLLGKPRRGASMSRPEIVACRRQIGLTTVTCRMLNWDVRALARRSAENVDERFAAAGERQ
jgi:hypothetical protein